jgi:hypothetical protein
MAEIVLFVDVNFGGLHTHMYDTVADFRQLALGGVGSGIGGDWNDVVSSLVVESGTWQAFRDINFSVPQGPHLVAGMKLNFVENVGIDNDSMSSILKLSDFPTRTILT